MFIIFKEKSIIFESPEAFKVEKTAEVCTDHGEEVTIDRYFVLNYNMKVRDFKIIQLDGILKEKK